MSVTVLGAPPGLTLDLGEGAVVTSDPDAGAVILFVADRRELSERRATLVEAVSADRVAWVAYPKGGQLGTDLNRDVLWELLAAEGIRPVRQVSIDDTWSALRFRPT